MYQLLTGVLPYDTPAPSDLERLRRGELATPPRLRNASIPTVIEQIIMRALSGEVSARYQRAEDFLNDLLGARREIVRRSVMSTATPAATGPVARATGAPARPTPTPARPFPEVRRTPATRAHAREATGRFCLHCRKPLPARAARCPFCGESQ